MARLQRLVRVFASLVLALLGMTAAAHGDPIVVDNRPIPLDGAQPERTRLGGLVYRGGVEISSKDPRFGGVSGLRVAADGSRFVAVTDVGFWMTGALRYNPRGDLLGIDDVSLERLRDTGGRPLAGKYDGDAEALTAAADGGYIVAFEERHRLVRYRRVGGAGEAIPPPPDLGQAPANGGIETLTTLADGGLLAITETWDVDGGVRGWIGPAPWRAFVWPTSEGFRPTEAATLPDGDVLILERRFPLLAVRILRVEAAQLRSGRAPQPIEIARFEGSINFDNMEAMAVRRGANGEILLYVASDDNQSFLQRTLLLLFEVEKGR